MTIKVFFLAGFQICCKFGLDDCDKDKVEEVDDADEDDPFDENFVAWLRLLASCKLFCKRATSSWCRLSRTFNSWFLSAICFFKFVIFVCCSVMRCSSFNIFLSTFGLFSPVIVTLGVGAPVLINALISAKSNAIFSHCFSMAPTLSSLIYDFMTHNLKK